MIIHAKENELTWFDSLDLEAIPHNLPSGIKVHQRGKLIGLEVGGLVGSLALLNGDTLHIDSKVGDVNFLRLLFKAEGNQKELFSEYESFVHYFLDDENNVNFLVAKNLLIAADEIMRRSPLQGRLLQRSRSSYLRGQVETVNTILNIARYQDDPVVSYLKKKTVNIAENRVLTEAVTRAWQTVEDQSDNESFKRIKDRWIRRFPSSENIIKDLDHVERSFSSGQYGGSRDYYRKALMLAQVILGAQGLGFTEGAIVEGNAMLLNTATIFEKYVRNIIANAYLESGFVVSKGGATSHSLYTDGSFALEPDIFISKSGNSVLIADAKYKKPDSSDHYQMQAYLRAYGIKSGLLISPLFNGNEVKIKEYSTYDNIVVREAYLPMQNLSTTEDFLASIVSQFQ